MRYGSVCSGIEAATSAWHSLGWTPQWFSEIEPFPSAVLAHHYPDVPNLGDMTNFKNWTLDDSTAIDVLVGGTPCQSFSVAGLRKGLDDPRGNLMLTFLAIARKYRPKWLVWENVPGVLSSSGGEDFASLLRGMGECGYGFAYRVLDAQYFGVAQRRRRVFVVGCLGDWRAAAAVLFERHSLSGHPAPSRKARKSPPGFFESSLAQYREADVGGTLKASGGVLSGGSETFIKTQWPAELAPTLNAKYGEKMGLENQHIDGGAGMFTLQPIPIHDQATRHAGKHGDKQDGKGNGLGIGQPGDPMNTLTKGDRHAVAQPVYGLHGQSGVVTEFKDICHTIAAAYGNGGGNIPVTVQPVAFNFAPGKGELKDDIHITTANVSKTIDASGSNPAMHQGGTGVVQSVSACDVADTLTVGANQTTGFIGDVVAIPISTQNALGRVNGRDDWPLGIFNDGDPAPTLSKSHGHAVATNIHAFPWQSALDPIGKPSDISGTLIKNQTMAVAYAFDALSSNSMKSSNPDSGVNQVDVSKTLDTSRGLDPSCNQGGIGIVQNAYSIREDAKANTFSATPLDVSTCLGLLRPSVQSHHAQTFVAASMAVRRLTPIECERLQGFPDNHTNIPWRKKPESPDGPRYKALGNSMAVPVMHWIGKRIQMVEDL